MSTWCNFKKNERYLFLILLILGFTACGLDPEVKKILRSKKVLNIGHAGMGFSSVINPFNPLPDNSMAAIQKAMLLGADGVEVDVQLSRDSILILYHDKFLESKTSLTGCINDHVAADVLGAGYISDFPFNLWHDERLVGLDSLFAVFSRRDTFPWVYLDIRSHNYCNKENAYSEIPKFARALERAIKKAAVPIERVCPTSTHVPMLLEIRKAIPGIGLWYEETGNFEHGVKTVEDNQFTGLVIKRSLLPEPDRMKDLEEKGIEIVLFGGKAKWTLEEMLMYHPDVMQVNNVKAFEEILEESRED